jgi:tetratricopeptide (TPR) repeat protein
MEVTQYPRIEELRRRMQKDPTSIAFAQLAEEYRRTGSNEEAISTCRAGLAHHPTYLSARVTLGRALMELGRFKDAKTELEAVREVAPDNLAALRGLAEIHQRRGESGDTSPVDHPPTRTPQPLEALNALDALTLDLPPTPEFSPLSLDPQFPVPDEPHAAQPEPDESFAAPVSNPAISNPAIAELERWLAAIVEDRSTLQ